MKKVLAISSVLLGVVFLAGCGQQSVSQTQPTTPAPVAQTPTQPVATQPAPTTPDNSSNWKTYTDTKLGFQFDYLASSGFDHSKLKVNAWECDTERKEKCVELQLPTSDKDFVASASYGQKITADKMYYNVFYIHIAPKSSLANFMAECKQHGNESSSFCNPEAYHKGNKLYYSSNGNTMYVFDNFDGQPASPQSGKQYPSDGIPWSSFANFKAL